MTVQELINQLKKCKNPKHSDIEFYADGKEVELKSIGQFGIIQDVIIHFEVILSYEEKHKMIVKKLKAK